MTAINSNKDTATIEFKREEIYSMVRHLVNATGDAWELGYQLFKIWFSMDKQEEQE